MLLPKRYVGRLVRAAREAKGWSQQELADRMGTGKSSVVNIELDENQPVLGLLWALEEALGLAHGELVRQSYAEQERLSQESRRRGRPAKQRRPAETGQADRAGPPGRGGKKGPEGGL